MMDRRSRAVLSLLDKHREAGHHTETRAYAGGIRPVIVDKRGRTVAILPRECLSPKHKESVLCQA